MALRAQGEGGSFVSTDNATNRGRDDGERFHGDSRERLSANVSRSSDGFVAPAQSKGVQSHREALAAEGYTFVNHGDHLRAQGIDGEVVELTPQEAQEEAEFEGSLDHFFREFHGRIFFPVLYRLAALGIREDLSHVDKGPFPPFK
eukprot:TRINITY_DN14661_c1_g1_i1.p1 TRINITY_DN14661_c1_g1~~TRINITY_DN14661_c1_g1_i1.p1  ORF type:complete len:146 (+),score=20.64 TRINITY_DN14661_c1_g1_i1:63-500(+)